ncbi:hypothetical protein ETB97_002994 [Aspergillus alliaceus]|uniref:Uncharacterized protein n=1 Tax=Petromyces alliaceus TaxID=209559 RepID=A0A8H6A1V0_PETAA|nr:hypothetical protein ETB97_002994 [Aspergillus burnettii]
MRIGSLLALGAATTQVASAVLDPVGANHTDLATFMRRDDAVSTLTSIAAVETDMVNLVNNDAVFGEDDSDDVAADSDDISTDRRAAFAALAVALTPTAVAVKGAWVGNVVRPILPSASLTSSDALMTPSAARVSAVMDGEERCASTTSISNVSIEKTRLCC